VKDVFASYKALSQTDEAGASKNLLGALDWPLIHHNDFMTAL
jgi:hypothetical protein